jgi:hypothetical protein
LPQVADFSMFTVQFFIAINFTAIAKLAQAFSPIARM